MKKYKWLDVAPENVPSNILIEDLATTRLTNALINGWGIYTVGEFKKIIPTLTEEEFSEIRNVGRYTVLEAVYLAERLGVRMAGPQTEVISLLGDDLIVHRGRADVFAKELRRLGYSELVDRIIQRIQ
jgi:hypothetical protein